MDKRTILAVILSLIVLIGWSYLFQKKYPPQRPTPVGQPKAAESKYMDKAKPEVPQPPKSLTTPNIPTTPPPIETNGRDIVVESDLYKVVFSTQGAIVKYWELKKYEDQNGKPVILLKKPGIIPPLGIIFEGPDRNLPQKLIYSTNTRKLILSKQGNLQGEIVFTYSNQNLSIRKKFVFYNDKYKVDLSIETVNTPPYLLPIGTDFGIFDKKQREHKGPVMLHNSDRKEFDEDLKSSRYFTGNIQWIAQEDKYFTAAIIPLTPIDGANVWKEDSTAEIALKLKPQKHDFIFYVGPKEYDRLKEFGAGLEHIVDFGWFAFVAMPLFWVLKFFYKFLGNYGWAIVLLTIVVRVPFIPIMHKSQQSMKKLQKIQPLIAELKEKYKHDSQKMQKEMMAIYKKHKVNPIGGCLPMFLQIPIFIALYNVLLKAIELRGAPFALWITDLSAKDPYYVLPIVMGLTMLIQQKMTPSAMDPKQAKMMMLMPIVFTFMFLTFPAGLVLYWLINNIIGIIQQYYVNKKA
jgi:YidC/Oxa1 family membrane protein insertase